MQGRLRQRSAQRATDQATATGPTRERATMTTKFDFESFPGPVSKRGTTGHDLTPFSRLSRRSGIAWTTLCRSTCLLGHVLAGKLAKTWPNLPNFWGGCRPLDHPPRWGVWGVGAPQRSAKFWQSLGQNLAGKPKKNMQMCKASSTHCSIFLALHEEPGMKTPWLGSTWPLPRAGRCKIFQPSGASQWCKLEGTDFGSETKGLHTQEALALATGDAVLRDRPLNIFDMELRRHLRTCSRRALGNSLCCFPVVFRSFVEHDQGPTKKRPRTRRESEPARRRSSVSNTFRFLSLRKAPPVAILHFFSRPSSRSNAALITPRRSPCFFRPSFGPKTWPKRGRTLGGSRPQTLRLGGGVRGTAAPPQSFGQVSARTWPENQAQNT